jgi:hypothetical protein
MVQYSFCYKLQFRCLPHIYPGQPTAGLGPDEKFFRPLYPDGPVTILCTQLERLTLTHTVPLAWSEKVNMHNRQIMTLPRNTKTRATQSATRPFRTAVVCTGFPLPPSWQHCMYPSALPTHNDGPILQNEQLKVLSNIMPSEHNWNILAIHIVRYTESHMACTANWYTIQSPHCI